MRVSYTPILIAVLGMAAPNVAVDVDLTTLVPAICDGSIEASFIAACGMAEQILNSPPDQQLEVALPKCAEASNLQPICDELQRRADQSGGGGGNGDTTTPIDVVAACLPTLANKPAWCDVAQKILANDPSITPADAQTACDDFPEIKHLCDALTAPGNPDACPALCEQDPEDDLCKTPQAIKDCGAKLFNMCLSSYDGGMGTFPPECAHVGKIEDCPDLCLTAPDASCNTPEVSTGCNRLTTLLSDCLTRSTDSDCRAAQRANLCPHYCKESSTADQDTCQHPAVKFNCLDIPATPSDKDWVWKKTKTVKYRTAMCPRGQTLYPAGCPPPTSVHDFCPKSKCANDVDRDPHTCLCPCDLSQACPPDTMRLPDCSCKPNADFCPGTTCDDATEEMDRVTCECHPKCAETEPCADRMERRSSDCKCICLNTAREACPNADDKFNPQTCQCEAPRCPNGKKKVAGVCPADCESKDCPNEHLDLDTCQCSADPMTCPTVMCDNGRKPRADCSCPDTCGEDKCVAPAVQDPNSCQCTCPTGAVTSGADCGDDHYFSHKICACEAKEQN